MKYVNFKLVDTTADAGATSQVMDLSQIYRLSGQVVVSSGTVDGSLQLQVSNDELTAGYVGLAEPTNWSNLGSAVALSTSGVTLIASQDVCYRSLRALLTNGNALVNTITAIADVAGSLNNTYFLLNTDTTNYYVWYNVASGGTDPMIAGRTGIEVDIASGATASTVAGATRTALAAATQVTVSGTSAQIITTNIVTGQVTPATDGAVPTGFTFANNAPTASVILNIMALAI